MSPKPQVHEFGMGVDVHGRDATKAACRAVSDSIRHSSLPLFQEVRERGGKMLVDVTVGVPDPAAANLPSRARSAPEKAPSQCPNSSLSNSEATRAPQGTTRKPRFFRDEH